MKDIPDRYVDMVLCDLPFGKTQNKWDVIIPFEELWKHYNRICKPTAAIVLNAAQPFTSMLVMSNLPDFKYCWSWNKKRPTGHLNSKKQPLRQHEDVCVFYKKQSIYNPQMHTNRLSRDFIGNVQKSNKQSDNYGLQLDYKSNIKANSLSYPRSVLEITTVIGNSKEKVKHSTQKPIALGRYFIKTYTNEGMVILDNCSGSGSYPIAAILEKRNFISFENNEEKYTEGAERIEKYKQQLKKQLFT